MKYLREMSKLLLIIFIVFIKQSSSFTISNRNLNFLDLLSDLQFNLGNNSIEHDSEKIYKETAEFLVNSLVPFYIEESLRNEKPENTLFQNLNVSENCFKHLEMFREQIKNILENPISIVNASTWALQMIDSWGKLPTEGMLSGHVNAYGDWDECVNVNAFSDESSFKGQYCWAYLIPSLMMKGSENNPQSKSAVSIPELIEEMLNPVGTFIIPSTATCVPNSCSTAEVQKILENLFQLTNISQVILPIVSLCNTNEYPSINTGTIAMIVLLSVLGILIIAGSLLDVLLNKRPQFKEIRKRTWVQVILAFSLVTNIRKWQNTSAGEGGFGCIHGMRFLSTCWVLLCHTVAVFSFQSPSWNAIDMNRIYEKNWTMYFILNGYFSVDTFFTMSGLLASYSILKGFQKIGKNLSVLTFLSFNLKMYLHRFLRLTPTYALIIGVIATLYPYMGDGPYFTTWAEPSTKACQDYWWHNLLYFNNIVYYNVTLGENMCEGESWYIANDMQFFILAPFFVVLLWKWKRVGMAVLGSACVASMLIPAIQVGTEKLAPTFIFWKRNLQVDAIYMRPWNRIGPYFVGIWMGYILFQIGKKPVKLSKWAVACGWILSTATALSLILGVIPYYYPDNDDNAVGSAFYAGLSKFVWGIVICWIIFACVKGYGGWVNSFLSWKVFIPLGRLTFCVYLSSMSIQCLLQLTIRQPMEFEMYRVTNLFFSHVITCFLVGFILTMTFESPFIALEKILFSSVFQSREPNREIKSQDENGNAFGNEVKTESKDETRDVKA